MRCLCAYRITAATERSGDLYVVVHNDGAVLWMPRVNYRILADKHDDNEIKARIRFVSRFQPAQHDSR